ncbi:MAG: DUF456 domain-containing protein [Betaproteobacteria bacterium]|nr:DUF456 domain-containing protein [Betaproteobacteria bacterium]
MTPLVLWLLSALLVLAGLAGSLLPVLPGAPFVFAGLALAAWIDSFERVGMGTLIVIGALAALSFAIDLVASVHGARRAGASKQALMGAGIGAALGALFGLLGLIVGPFLGAAVGQLIAGSDLLRAGRVGFGAWTGFLVGSVLKLVIGLAMVAIFVISYAF